MTYLCLERSERNDEKHDKKKPLIPLMNEGLGELKCRRHFVLCKGYVLQEPGNRMIYFREKENMNNMERRLLHLNP